MKKALLFLAFALFATAFLKAQEDVNLGDFEDEVTNNWMLYGESYKIVENPLIAAPNTSDFVLQNITVNQYQGMSMHNLSYIKADFVMFSFDVYNATGAVNFICNVHGKTSEGTDVTASYYPTTIDGAWLHYEVDLTNADDFATMDIISQLDLQNNTAETELYWDNILLTAVGGGTTSVVNSISNNTNDLLFYPNPANCNDLLIFSEAVEDNATVKIYNITGQLQLSAALTNRSLDISSLNPGQYMVKIGTKVSKLLIE